MRTSKPFPALGITSFFTLSDPSPASVGVLPEGTGFVDGKLISQTGELVFDPDHAQFVMHGEKCAYFSGQPNGAISLGHGITAHAENQRLSLAALSLDGKPLADSKEVLLTAVGETGMMKPPKAPWSSSLAYPSPPALSRASCTPTRGRGASS